MARGQHINQALERCDPVVKLVDNKSIGRSFEPSLAPLVNSATTLSTFSFNLHIPVHAAI